MLLPRPLVILKLLELRGMARRMLRQMKRPSGALFVVIYIAIFLPSILGGLYRRESQFRLTPEWILNGAPLVIGLFCLLSMLAPESRVAMNFRPAEIDVLFTGPYLRRHILTYKLLGTALGALFMAAIFFMASLAFSPASLPMFAGLYLAILFGVLFGSVYSMLIQAVSVRAKYAGYAIVAAVFAAIGYAVYSVMTDLSNSVGMQALIDNGFTLIFEHPVVRWMSAPFMPFAHVMAADGGGAAWVAWTSLSVAIIVALYAIIVVLDADYMEAAIARSAKQYATLERFKRGQFISASTAARGRRWSLVGVPRLGGFGPIAWRQLTGAAHAWGRSVAALYVICVVCGFILRRYGVDETDSKVILPAVMGFLVYLSVIASNFFRFDFRSDLDVMDGLKTLPISSRRIAAAQIVAPAALLTSVYLAVGLGTAIAVDRIRFVAFIGLLAVPFTALMIAIDNLVFLFWPARMAYQGSMDIQGTGRNFLGMMVKFLILGPACALAVAVALACGFLLESWTLGYVAAACVMAIEAALVIPALAGAFEKFDPSTDTPP